MIIALIALSFNSNITSNKTKYFEVQKYQSSLTRKDYNFLLEGIHFTSNVESQNMFFYQPTLDTLELKKDKGTDYVLIIIKREYIILNLSHNILLPFIA